MIINRSDLQPKYFMKDTFKMKKDFILTFLTQIIILISGLAVFKLAIMQFGDIGFSEFSIVKRNLAYLYTLIFLGLGVSVPRYIANEIGINSGNENNVFFAALIIVILSLITTGVLFFIFQEKTSFLLFGDGNYIKFLLPVFVSIIGLSMHSIVYSYYRGKMLFHYSNLLQITNMGFIPLSVFIFSESIEEVFLYTGYMMSTFSLIVLLKVLFLEDFNFNTSLNFIPKIFTYGIQRLPADFGLASLLALPVIFTAHTQGIIEAGYVAFSLSLLGLSGQAVAPIGLIMLPKISHLLGKNNFIKIQYYVKKLFIFSVLIAVIGTTIYQLFAKEILYLYLGEVELDLINISKSVMWGALFYPFYVTMRSIIDAYYVQAYNTFSILISLMVFLFLFFLTDDIYNSLIIALTLLSLITFYFIKPLLVTRVQ